jgi:hypothetical protein
MLFKEIIVVCSEDYMKPINTLRGQNAELLNVKAGRVKNEREDRNKIKEGERRRFQGNNKY